MILAKCFLADCLLSSCFFGNSFFGGALSGLVTRDDFGGVARKSGADLLGRSLNIKRGETLGDTLTHCGESPFGERREGRRFHAEIMHYEI